MGVTKTEAFGIVHNLPFEKYQQLPGLNQSTLKQWLSATPKQHGRYKTLQALQLVNAGHSESKESIFYTDDGYPVIWSEGVISITVDYICDQLGVIPNSMKIDTDGNEGSILDGAKNTLSNKLFRSLIIEVPDGKVGDHCCNILKLNGFENVWFDSKTKNQIWKRKL